MSKEQFLAELTDILQLEEMISEKQKLSELDEWDSMAFLGVISFFDMEFSLSISNADLKKIDTVAELIDLAGLSIGAK